MAQAREQFDSFTFYSEKARDFWRYISNEAYEVQPDNLGRITLPTSLTELAKLQKEVVVVGSMQYIEVWDRNQYHQYLDQISDQAEEIAESLSWENQTQTGS